MSDTKTVEDLPVTELELWDALESALAERDRLVYRLEFVASWLRPITELDASDRFVQLNTESMVADAILGRGWFADNDYMDKVISWKAEQAKGLVGSPQL